MRRRCNQRLALQRQCGLGTAGQNLPTGSNLLGKDLSNAQQMPIARGNDACPDGVTEKGVNLQQGKEMILTLLGAWKSQLERLQEEIGRALGDILEGLKVFGLYRSPSLLVVISVKSCVGPPSASPSTSPRFSPPRLSYIWVWTLVVVMGPILV
jgi:hypothetical protein